MTGKNVASILGMHRMVAHMMPAFGDASLVRQVLAISCPTPIIHRHGGRIWAESTVNEGAVFYFTLGGKETKSA